MVAVRHGAPGVRGKGENDGSNRDESMLVPTIEQAISSLESWFHTVFKRNPGEEEYRCRTEQR